MKTYLKDLTAEEIIRRLKNGEVVKIEGSKSYIKMIDGVICRFYAGGVCIGNSLFKEPDDVYFETKEPFEITGTGLYKTRDGRKVFVSKIYKTGYFPVWGIIEGDEELMHWALDGFVFSDKREDNQDIISKWED